MGEVKHIVIVDPIDQINEWILGSKQQWKFWDDVVRREMWSGLNKTKSQAENLIGYYEGQYDLALSFREFVLQKKISQFDDTNDVEKCLQELADQAQKLDIGY